MNHIITYYSQIINNVLHEVSSNKSKKVVAIRYDNSLKGLIDQQLLILSKDIKCINFESLQTLSANEELKTSNTNLPKKIIGDIVLWFILFPFNHFFIATDLLVSISKNMFDYYISKNEINIIQGKLKASNKPKRKYKKNKRIIIVKDYDKLNDVEQKYLSLLIYLINEKFVVNTLLIILYNSSYYEKEDYYLEVTIKELNLLFKFNKVNDKNIYLFKKIDINFYTIIYNALTKNYNKNEQALLKIIIHESLNSLHNNISNEEMFKFFKLCSYLFPSFSQRDIENNFSVFHSNILECLDKAVNVSLFQKEILNMYSFTESYIREFFVNYNYILLKTEQKNSLYAYLKMNYSKQYLNLAIASIKLNQSYTEILSQIAIVIYYAKYFSNEDKKSLKYIIQIQSQTDIFNSIIELKKTKNIDYIDDIIKSKDYVNCSLKGRLALLGVILPELYEFNGEEKNKQIIHEYNNLFNECNITSEIDETYLSFIIDCIILSSSVELNYKLKNLIDKLNMLVKENENMLQEFDKIRYYRLANLVDNNPEPILKKGFDLSEEIEYIHELFRINYMVALIFSKKYKLAKKVCNDKNRVSLKNIDYDSFISFENNKIIVNFLNKKHIKINPFNSLIKKIKDNEIHSDFYIIYNNQIAFDIYLGKFSFLKYDLIINKISRSNDLYHQFFLYYNLIIYAYLFKDKEYFNRYINIIKVPSLLDKYKDYFEKKLKILKKLYDSKTFYDYDRLKQEFFQLNEKFPNLRIGLYDEVLLFGIIERWYE